MAARPATRKTTPTPRVAPSRAAIRDFSGGGGYTVEWDVRPVYDFVFSLSDDAGSTDDLPAADRQWLADARSSLPQDLRASARQLFGEEVAIQIATFAVERPDLRTARQFVDAIEAAGPTEVLGAVFCELAREPGLQELIDAVLAGHRGRLGELEALLPEWHREERLRMLGEADATYDEVVGVLRAWLEAFEPIEERVAAMGERDYALRAPDRGSLGPADLVERTTNGLRWLGEPGVRRIILAPSYFSRPYNFLLAGGDWRFFGYPIADDALDAVDPLAPPQSVVRLHRALGDDTRLRILKLLAARDLYLTEIAQALELSKPTIKHHLALLRAAGLVTVTESGTVMYYSVRRQRLDDASIELKAFLVGDAGEAPRRRATS
jgi:DNA-binding transcriptional ArsR family regulator